MKLYTHLNFGGNCEAAFRYLFHPIARDACHPFATVRASSERSARNARVAKDLLPPHNKSRSFAPAALRMTCSLSC